MKWLLWCTLFMLNTSNASEQQASPDWLKTVAFAGHLTDFSGVFVYQYNDRIETYRISHVVASDSEYEKVISLDGPKQEIIRHHGQTWCYRNHKMVQVASQQGKAKFPTILIDQLSNLNDSYLVQDAGTSNVAGYATRVIIFQPKDKLRYSHQIWVNTDTGLLLKSVVLDDKKQVLEQYVFTQLKIGVEADRTWLPETKADNRLSLPTTKTDAAISTNSGWVVDSLPQGFTKSQEVKRPMSGKHAPVIQLVYSDGMSAISVFIETADADEDDTEGLSNRGALNLYHKVVDQHLFTVVGEVPARTVMQVLNSIRFNGK